MWQLGGSQTGLAKTKLPTERLALVPRLSEVAAPLLLGEERDKAIRGALKVALAEIAEQGKGSHTEYRSHWVYGVHRLG